MKTYISTGIGDLFFLDSILTKEEKKASLRSIGRVVLDAS